MQGVQLTLFDISETRETFSPFRAMSKMSIDEIFCIAGKVLTSIISMIGLIVILSGVVETNRREEEIEEWVYRRDEDEELLMGAFDVIDTFQLRMISPAQKRMVLKDAIKRKMRRDRSWRNKIKTDLCLQ